MLIRRGLLLHFTNMWAILDRFSQVSKAIRGEKEEEDTEPDSSAPENGETKPESPTSLDETVRELNNR